MTARVAQWIRRRSPKPKIASSSLAVGKYFSIISFLVFDGISFLGTMPQNVDFCTT